MGKKPILTVLKAEGHSADTGAGKFPLVSMGGRAEGPRAQTRERGPPSALAEILYQFLLQKFLMDRSLLHKYFLDKPLLNKSLVDKSLLHHSLLHKSLMNRFLMDKSLLYMSLLHKFLLYKFLLLKSFLNKFLKAWSLLMTILFTILARPLGLSDLFLLPLVYLVILWSSPTT